MQKSSPRTGKIAPANPECHPAAVSGGKPEWQSSARKRRRSTGAMPKWKALLMLAAIGAGCLVAAGVICWTQAPARVRCDRVSRDRVDVMVERRLLGFYPISAEVIPDVINAFGVRIAGSKKSGSGSSFSQNALLLAPREGTQRRVSGVASQLGRPKAMARQIDEFIKTSSQRSLTLWYIPWLLHLLALPFVFVAFLMLWGLGEGLLRTLGFLKPEPPLVE